VNKRRFEELEDCNTLHVKGIKADADYLKSEDFKTLYLSTPCNCCGSKRHSLLGIKNKLQTRNGRIQYEYCCPVASYEDIDRIDKQNPNNELTISFWLDSEKYANECQFSPSIARSKFKELENSITATYEVIMDRFKDQVIEVCQENTGARIEQKRQRREILQKEKELMFTDIFLMRPCRICGGEDHAVLQNIWRLNGERTYNYECPSAMANDYETVRHRKLGCRLQICPRKFAKACGGDKLKVMERHLGVVEQQGARMKDITSFLTTALLHCDEETRGSNQRTKRRTSSG